MLKLFETQLCTKTGTWQRARAVSRLTDRQANGNVNIDFSKLIIVLFLNQSVV